MSIGKKLRFEIFKQDHFTCQYCGRKTPDVVLELDHIVPKAEGGTDDPTNLITSCFECNRGKGKTPLGELKARTDIEERKLLLAEQELQIREYNKLVAQKRRRLSKEANQVHEVFLKMQGNVPGGPYRLNAKAMVSVTRFTDKLGLDETTSSMELAFSRIYFCRSPSRENVEQTFLYFCGICWRQIRDQQGGDQ